MANNEDELSIDEKLSIYFSIDVGKAIRSGAWMRPGLSAIPGWKEAAEKTAKSELVLTPEGYRAVPRESEKER